MVRYLISLSKTSVSKKGNISDLTFNSTTTPKEGFEAGLFSFRK